MDALSEAISKAFREGIIIGFWQTLKWAWPLIPLIILLKIFEIWINRKIDNRKRRRRFQK